MNIATNSAYTAQTTAASVGVKMPNLRPKMMIPGSISAQTASTSAGLTSLRPRRSGVTRVAPPAREPPRDGQPHTEDDARHDAGEEQLRDRQPRGGAEDDEADRRR